MAQKNDMEAIYSLQETTQEMIYVIRTHLHDIIEAKAVNMSKLNQVKVSSKIFMEALTGVLSSMIFEYGILEPRIDMASYVKEICDKPFKFSVDLWREKAEDVQREPTTIEYDEKESRDHLEYVHREILNCIKLCIEKDTQYQEAKKTTEEMIK